MLEKCLYPGCLWKEEIELLKWRVPLLLWLECTFNSAIWLTQNFFVYFKDCLLCPKLCIFLHLIQFTKYTILICIIQTDSSFPFCVNLQSYGDDKIFPNLPKFIFILHQQKMEEKKQALNSSLKLSQWFLKHASLYFPKYVITICTFFIK